MFAVSPSVWEFVWLKESLSFGIILGEVYSQCGIARLYTDVMSVSSVCIPERKGLAARTYEAILAGLGN